MTEFLVRYAQCDSRRAHIAVMRAQQEKICAAAEEQRRVQEQKLLLAREKSRQAQQLVRAIEQECVDLQNVVRQMEKSLAGIYGPELRERAHKELLLKSQLLSQAEEKLLAAWEGHAQSVAYEKLIVQESLAVEDQFHNVYSTVRDTLDSYTLEDTQLLQEHETISAQFPEQLRAVCIDLVSRFKNPILMISGSSCTGCFTQLRPQDENLLGRGHWIRCHSCTRILLYGRGE